MAVTPSARPALCTVPRGARSICGSPNSQYQVGGALASGASNDLTTVQHTKSNSLEITTATSHAFELWALTTLPGGALLAGTRTRGASHARMLTTCVAAHTLRGRVLSVHGTASGALAVSSEGLTMFSLAEDGKLVEFGSENGADVGKSGANSDVVAGGLAGARVFITRASGTIELRDPRETRAARLGGADAGELAAPARAMRVSCATSARNGDSIALASEHGELAVIDLRTGMLREARDAHHGWVSALAAVDNGRLLVSGGADGVVKVWSNELELLAMLPHHADSVYGIAAGERSFATVSYDGRVAVNAYPVR